MIRNLLVVIEDPKKAARRLDTAVEMARRHDAHLVALAVAAQPTLDYSAGAGFGTELIVEELQRARERADDMAKTLTERLSASGISAEARPAARSFPGIADEVARQGRYADLILSGRDEGDDGAVLDKAADGALFDSGKPAVLIPPDWDKGAFGKRIMVAWDASREAARAIAAAMPLIEGADAVSVALADPYSGSESHGEEPGADIGASLSRHNGNVTVDRLAGMGHSVAETLIAHATDVGADLVVLGAYGHTRLAEAIFGGVTRDMMKACPVPLLLAH